MKRLLPVLSLCAVLFLTTFLGAAAGEQGSGKGDPVSEAVNPPLRELSWDTYLDKVQGAWMGKMIGVTFGQPWEFQYQNTPIGFDITDWPLSPTRMKDYRARAENKPGQEDWNPITREADNQKIVLLHNFIEASEKD